MIRLDEENLVVLKGMLVTDRLRRKESRWDEGFSEVCVDELMCA